MTDTKTAVRVNDVTLNVERSGEGPPVVLLHGFTGSTLAMGPLVEHLSRDYLVIAVDLVGHGQSTVSPDARSYTTEAMAQQVLGVFDALRLTTAHVVGYSMGGRVALSLACDAGYRLRSLSLIGASPGIADPDAREQRRQADRALANSILDDGLESFVDRWMANPLFATQARLGEEFLAGARRQRLQNSPIGLAESLRNGGSGSMRPLHDDLVRCATDALLVVGQLDEKFVQIAEAMARSLPRVVVDQIADVGHAAHVEAPDRVSTSIARHLRWVETTLPQST